MARRVSSPEFVGRRQELTTLLEALERASVGEFAAIFLAGDSGVGKSRLLRQLARVAEERGAHVLAGDCLGLAEVALAGAERVGKLGMRDRRRLLEAEAATRLFNLGRLDDADRLTDAALELSPSLANLDQCATRAQVEVHRGRIAEAEVLIQAAVEATSHVPGATWVEPLASTRVELELLRGRPEEARRLGEKVLERAGDDEKVVFTARVHAVTARAAALLAERARAAADEVGAAEAAEHTTALADRIGRRLEREVSRGTPPPETLAYRELCTAEAMRAAGTVAAPDWEAVAKHWAGLGMPLEETYVRLRQTECLISAPADATADKADASDPVERLGLTERELAVLELVARGMTNRQIGEQPFMAPKTASVHVSRILTKLEVSSRVEAATAAQRLGLVP